VLGGRLSPLDGRGPESLRIALLEERLSRGTVREIILATNPSLEGEATATYLVQRLAGRGIKITRLARGLPVGGDLDYVDGATLSLALEARQEVT
jgi:recombination protein RecR